MELQDVPEPPKIRVVVRKRPLSEREGQQQDIVEMTSPAALVVKEIKYVSTQFAEYSERLSHVRYRGNTGLTSVFFASDITGVYLFVAISHLLIKSSLTFHLAV